MKDEKVKELDFGDILQETLIKLNEDYRDKSRIKEKAVELLEKFKAQVRKLHELKDTVRDTPDVVKSIDREIDRATYFANEIGSVLGTVVYSSRI